MRAVIQRVTDADVSVNNEIVGKIDKGLVVLLGAEDGDSRKDADYLSEKIIGLRIFEDEDGKMNLSMADIGAQMLVVSQFTLLGDARKGKRPSFAKAARPEPANELYEYFNETVRTKGIYTATGIFGADMLVRINNDGPVTILLDSKKIF